MNMQQAYPNNLAESSLEVDIMWVERFVLTRDIRFIDT